MDLLHQLRTHKFLAIVRGRDPRASVHCTVALADAGIRLLEVSLTTRNALAVISEAAAALAGRAIVGAGTIMSAADARRATGAGATFLVTPGIPADLGDIVALGHPTIVGAWTPSEIMHAHATGATAVKIFPAAVAGPQHVRWLREPLPDVALVPVGGVDLASAKSYLDAGATAVGLGRALLGDAPHGGDVARIHERVAQLLGVMQS